MDCNGKEITMPTFDITAPDGTKYSVTGPEGATQQEALAKVQEQHGAKAAAPAPEKPWYEKAKDVATEGAKQYGSYLGGMVAGAGDIGSTLISANEMLPTSQAVNWAKQQMGAPAPMSGAERRQKIKQGIGEVVDTNNLGYGVGQVVGQTAGTAGLGAPVAAVARPVAPGLAAAIEAGGMGAWNGFRGAATNIAGGAIAGAAQAGAVNPENTEMGAAFGAALPVVAKPIAKWLNPSEMLNAVEKKAMEAGRKLGYIVPPSQANPGPVNSTLSSLSGKTKTEQAFSEANQLVTDNAARSFLKLPKEAELTPETMKGLVEVVSEPYSQAASLGKFKVKMGSTELPPSVRVERVQNPLTSSTEKQVDASELVEAWKTANADAKGYWNAYGRDAHPETKAKAKAAEAVATKIDDFLMRKIEESGDPQLAQALKDARVSLAKIGVVERSLTGSGHVDLGNVAKIAKKGLVTDELGEAVKFHNSFKKATQTLKAPAEGVSVVDIGAAALRRVIDPSSLAWDIATLGARPLARRAMMTGPYQRTMVDPVIKGNSFIPQMGQGRNALIDAQIQAMSQQRNKQ